MTITSKVAMSAEIKDLAAALAKLRGKLPLVPKNRSNPHFKSRYADLDGVLHVINPILSECGLAVPQFPITTEDGQIGVETFVIHTSGQYMSTRMTLKPGKPGPQEAGSILTYLKRYSFGSIIGVSTDEDDDGNLATPPPPPKKPTVGVYTGDDKQKAYLATLFRKHGIDTSEDRTKISELAIERKILMSDLDDFIGKETL